MNESTSEMLPRPVSNPHYGSEYKTSNFSPAFLFLSKPQRAGLKAIYSFCREVDDIVDLEGGSRESAGRKLEAWAAFVQRQGMAPKPELGVRLTAAMREFRIPEVHLLEIIDGVRMDLTHPRYGSFEDLKKYCYGVASAVGLCCLPIFGVPIPEGQDYAVNLGIAFQLTNILRDVATDADRGRIYIPSADLKRFGYTERELMNRVFNERFSALMAFESERAQSFYVAAAQALPFVWRRRLLPARVMTAVYGGILEKIRKGGFRVFEGKVSLGTFSKWAAVARTVAGA
jgi:phytoene synthase